MGGLGAATGTVGGVAAGVGAATGVEGAAEGPVTFVEVAGGAPTLEAGGRESHAAANAAKAISTAV